MICPPLLVNHVDYLVAAKDRVGKKGRAGENAVWTEGEKKKSRAFYFSSCSLEDGLPLGIAYILKLLDQESDFDSLHFFDSAETLYQGMIDKLKHEIAGMHKRRQAEEIQARTATLNRLEKFLREFLLVKFAFQGAKTFFMFADDKTVAPPSESPTAPASGEGVGEAPAGPAVPDTEEDESYQESEAGGAYF